jgi:hypothetical protein
MDERMDLLGRHVYHVFLLPAQREMERKSYLVAGF